MKVFVFRIIPEPYIVAIITKINFVPKQSKIMNSYKSRFAIIAKAIKVKTAAMERRSI